MEDGSSDEIEDVYILSEEQESTKTSEEPPISEWSSLEEVMFRPNPKKMLEAQGLYSPGSGELCAKYIAMSTSSIFRHVFYKYPPLSDPGIRAALLGPEQPVIYADDGQEYYIALCDEMEQAPIKIFYKNLLMPRINLSYYGVNPAHVRAMALALQYNKIVQSLNLSDSFLTYDANYHLGRMLHSNTTLKELVLAGCRIGPRGFNCLANGLIINRTLIRLDLSGNCLEEDGGVIFAQALVSGMVVPQVSLSRNNLGMKTANALNEAFSITTQKMTHLDLSWNNFYHQPSTGRMIESLGESSVLQVLNLSWNSLEGDKIATAISNLMTAPALVSLDLSSNRFHEEEIVEKLVSNLIKAKKLQTLNLSSNPLSPREALIVIQVMLNPRVKVQNLLLDNICVNRKFIGFLERVKAMKSRMNVIVVYGGVLHDWVAKGPDPRAIVLHRAEYVSKADKKRRVDVALYFLQLNKEFGQFIPLQVLIDRADADGLTLSDELLGEFAITFPGPPSKKKKFINLGLIAEFIHRLWPERRLPPTPPPPPEPEPTPAPAPESGRERKTKDKGKKG